MKVPRQAEIRQGQVPTVDDQQSGRASSWWYRGHRLPCPHVFIRAGAPSNSFATAMRLSTSCLSGSHIRTRRTSLVRWPTWSRSLVRACPDEILHLLCSSCRTTRRCSLGPAVGLVRIVSRGRPSMRWIKSDSLSGASLRQPAAGDLLYRINVTNQQAVTASTISGNPELVDDGLRGVSGPG